MNSVIILLSSNVNPYVVLHGKFWHMYVQSMKVKFLIGVHCSIAVKSFQCSDSVRFSRVTKGLGMINGAGGGPLQAFCRSITFTSALLLSFKFYPYIRVALRDKVLAPPRLLPAGAYLRQRRNAVFSACSVVYLVVYMSGLCAHEMAKNRQNCYR